MRSRLDGFLLGVSGAALAVVAMPFFSIPAGNAAFGGICGIGTAAVIALLRKPEGD